MRLNKSPAPHIRFQDSNRTLMWDMILALAVLYGIAYLSYGWRTIVLGGTAIGAAVICDALCVLLRGRRPNIWDFSPVVTGMILALTMPATIPYPIVAASAAFAILIAKHPFGGTGHNLFNPAAAGFAFAATCWPGQTFSYPTPFQHLPVFGTITAQLQENPVFVLKVGGLPSNDPTDLLLGNYPGPMGATNILVILACMLFLIYCKTIRWQLPVCFLGSCALMAFLFPRVGSGRGLQSIIYELMSGLLCFGAVFMATDPVTSPKRTSSMAIYGTFAGILTMLFRYLGGYESTLPFALLLSNTLAPAIDRYSEQAYRLLRRKKVEAANH